MRRSHAYAAPACAIILAVVALTLPGPATARWVELGGEPVTVEMIESNAERSVVEITIGGFEISDLTIDGETYHQIALDGEGMSSEVGFPALPNIRRSLIIPDDREMAVRVIESEFIELPNTPIAPSKGNIPRSVDPATVPYTFDAFYTQDGLFPADALEADPPHILRDFRGLMVDANMFQYSPDSRTLRVTTRMLIEIVAVGPGQVNVFERTEPVTTIDRQFAAIYEGHFENFNGRYDLVLEDGGILVISYDSFMASMTPYVEWKLQKGIETKIVGLSETGSSYTQIASYIQTEYDDWAPAYVLLVGDAEQLPRHSGGSDPCYSLVDGGDDYPDLFVGRFSAETVTHVNTQVERTVHYERDVSAGPVWPQYGTGIASNQGPGHYGEYDNEHMDLIREDLLAYGYFAVDQIYDPSGTAAQVTAALNEGRGIVNYCGHGSTTSWGSTGFSNSHVSTLTNDNMLPFICSVACNNGTFSGGTCFGEAWLRATNGGVPTGAIAAYMSYISQSWDPPMYAEDEAVDLLCADVMRTVGGLWFNGSCHMIDMTGASGVNEFKNWMIFGDPSVCVRTKIAQEMIVNHTTVLLIGMSEYEVNVPGVEGALCALYADGVLYGSALTNAAGQAIIALAAPPTEPMTLTLTVTAYNKVTHIGTVEVIPPAGAYLVLESVIVLDDDGDADGAIDEGETVGIEITLENVGVEDATSITGVLGTTDPYVTVIDGAGSYPDIPAGGFGTVTEPYVIQVAGNVPDQHVVTFTLTTNANEGDWDSGFSLTAEAPVLVSSWCTVIDEPPGGDGDGNANAGETFTMQLWITNVGHSDADDLTGLLSCFDPHVTIQDDSGVCTDIPVGVDALMGDFLVELSPDCPEPTHIMLSLAVTDPQGFAADLAFDLPVGGWLDDFEVDRGWSVGAQGDGASSGIWECVDPIGTTYNGHVIQMEDDHTDDPGTLCFVTGNGSVGGTAGENDVDGGKTTLLSPVFRLSEAMSATISYYRWYTNQWGNNPNEDWWKVDVTDDGSTWVSLENTQASDESWVAYSFDLTDYVDLTDDVQIRFVAADNSPGSLVEAGVDDFLLVAFWPIVTEVAGDQTVVPATLAMGQNFPNPFNPVTTIQFDLPRSGQVDLAIYDVHGRRVTTLVNEKMEEGRYTVRWDGRSETGLPVASGQYFTRLKFGEQVLSGRMVLLK